MEKEKQKKDAPSTGSGLGSPFDEPSPTGMVTVSVGPYVQRVPAAGKPVSEVRKRFKAKMDIDDRSQAIVNGEEVGPDTILMEGQVLMFIHKSGEKGATISEVEKFLSNPMNPMEQRIHMLKALALTEDENQASVLTALVKKLSAKNAESVSDELIKQMADIMNSLAAGPCRVATFLELLDGGPRARVILDDGNCAFTTVPKAELLSLLERGDEVLLDKGANAIVHRVGKWDNSGSVAEFVREVEGKYVEVLLQDRSFLYSASKDLSEQIKAIKPGDKLVVGERERVAYRALPSVEFGHYRFLSKSPVPNVKVERDIGSPHACIEDCIEHIRMEMTDPDLGRAYGVRRSQMRLMAGVSGSGKTLAIQAIWSGVYDVMSKVTKTPVDKLPQRLCRMQMSEILSCYLGESDKNLARFFMEVEDLADKPFTNAAGDTFHLPVIAVMEEIDGLARARGHDHDGVYDRVLTTALQWLDSSRPELKDKLILYIGTTNEPGMIDRAFLRRVGGTVDRFTRLNRESFEEVLVKHLAKVPLKSDRDKAVKEITELVFGDERGVQLSLKGGQVLTRHRRDMLTGALVDRAVQEAARKARRLVKTKSVGIDLELLLRGFESQLDSIVEQLDVVNIAHYVDLPDGAQVAALRRLN